MAEENPKLKKYEAAVKKLKAANEKAAEKLEKQKNKY